MNKKTIVILITTAFLIFIIPYSSTCAEQKFKTKNVSENGKIEIMGLCRVVPKISTIKCQRYYPGLETVGEVEYKYIPGDKDPVATFKNLRVPGIYKITGFTVELSPVFKMSLKGIPKIVILNKNQPNQFVLGLWFLSCLI